MHVRDQIQQSCHMRSIQIGRPVPDVAPLMLTLEGLRGVRLCQEGAGGVVLACNTTKTPSTSLIPFCVRAPVRTATKNPTTTTSTIRRYGTVTTRNLGHGLPSNRKHPTTVVSDTSIGSYGSRHSWPFSPIYHSFDVPNAPTDKSYIARVGPASRAESWNISQAVCCFT